MYSLKKIATLGGDYGDVVVNASRQNSLSKVDGHHFVLSVYPALSWKDAELCGITRARIIETWDRNEHFALHLLLPSLTIGQISELGCQVIGNSKDTAARPDIHVHVRCAPKNLWGEDGNIARVVDDARKPRLIAVDVLNEVGIVGDEQVTILDSLYPPRKKRLDYSGMKPFIT